MSIFAGGIIIPEVDADLSFLAKSIDTYMHEIAPDFHMQFGGNATAYWLYTCNSEAYGLQFDLTNSLEENTAEAIFDNNDIVFSDASFSKMLHKMEDIQRVFSYVLATGCIKSIYFCVIKDYAPFSVSDFIECPIETLSQALSTYCISHAANHNLYLFID